MANTSTVYKIEGNFKGKDVISIDQFTPTDLDLLFSYVPKMRDIAKGSVASDLLKGTVSVLLFFEPSSRTVSSFSAAIKRLGGATIDFQNPQESSSIVKGETIHDMIKVMEAYSDIIIIRHSVPGTALQAAEAATIPVVNAGDGIGEHPTQALLDLFTIKERFGALENLTGVIAGDLLNGRTVHSLLRGLSLYKNNKIYLLSPQKLKLKKEDLDIYVKKGLQVFEIEKEEQLPKDAQFWYWTRVQKERFENPQEYEAVKNTFILTKDLLTKYGNNEMVIMHPLPRVGEILPEIDEDPRAIYLTTQVRNGMYVRMALVSAILGKNL